MFIGFTRLRIRSRSTIL